MCSLFVKRGTPKTTPVGSPRATQYRKVGGVELSFLVTAVFIK